MKSKLLVICSTLTLFSSCELMQTSSTSQTKVDIQPNQPKCIWNEPSGANDCNIEYWLEFWSEIEDISWPQRKKQIDELSSQEAQEPKDVDLLKKVLLSQGKSTPYQDRLRAQGWAASILPKLSQQMRRFIIVALYNPSQDLLELESALVTLSKINTQQSFKIEEQQMLLNKQQSQIEQLLNIEASIIQSIEEDK